MSADPRRPPADDGTGIKSDGHALRGPIERFDVAACEDDLLRARVRVTLRQPARVVEIVLTPKMATQLGNALRVAAAEQHTHRY